MDIIFPALEDLAALKILKKIADKVAAPIVFDWSSYEVTRSKKNSRNFFVRYGLPRALSWPQAEFPVIVKPVEGSGSRGIYKVDSSSRLKEVKAKFSQENNDIIIEEYLSGPAYSIEVIAGKEKLYTFLPTKLKFDDDYDCRQVLAGEIIPEDTADELKKLAERCAGYLNLTGIMDLEVIASRQGLKIMEIDARFPSQTPITVYEASGKNMVNILAKIFRQKFGEKIEGLSTAGLYESQSVDSVIYEQIRVDKGQIKTVGEHIISQARDLRLKTDFFGADKAITDYSPGSSSWRAILIFRGECMAAVREKRRKTFNFIER